MIVRDQQPASVRRHGHRDGRGADRPHGRAASRVDVDNRQGVGPAVGHVQASTVGGDRQRHRRLADGDRGDHSQTRGIHDADAVRPNVGHKRCFAISGNRDPFGIFTDGNISDDLPRQPRVDHGDGSATIVHATICPLAVRPRKRPPPAASIPYANGRSHRMRLDAFTTDTVSASKLKNVCANCAVACVDASMSALRIARLSGRFTAFLFSRRRRAGASVHYA